MAKSPNIEIVVIRSGRTEWDDARRVQGQTDLPLCAHASSELLSALAPLLTALERGPGVIFHAPDEASSETAKLAAGVFANGSAVRTKPISNLSAVGMGLWEGLLEDDLGARYPRKFKLWREDPTSLVVPDGEGVVEGQARILTALGKLADKTQAGPLAIVLRPFEYEALARLLDVQGVNGASKGDALPAMFHMTVPRMIFTDLCERLSIAV